MRKSVNKSQNLQCDTSSVSGLEASSHTHTVVAVRKILVRISIHQRTDRTVPLVLSPITISKL